MDGNTPDAVEVRNLVKGYKGVPVLDDVSFTVRRGTVFALLGANGSGKTTTVNILTTLIRADGGTARVAGFDVARHPAKVREQISLTGQFAAVDHVLTARENLVLMGELRHVADPRRTAADLLDRFGLGDAADRRLLTFSGGMRRRLDIAMGLIHLQLSASTDRSAIGWAGVALTIAGVAASFVLLAVGLILLAILRTGL